MTGLHRRVGVALICESQNLKWGLGESCPCGNLEQSWKGEEEDFTGRLVGGGDGCPEAQEQSGRCLPSAWVAWAGSV